ncbi:MAG: hypothetical protein JXQ73_26490 [Phycisphaerae bacterium]|nr:hypothetical protein [Phycisphaerae bacterium]
MLFGTGHLSGTDTSTTPQISRVQWTKESSPQTYRGWVSHRSTAALSFVTGAGDQPATGEKVEVTAADGSKEQYRVTRIASYDDRLCLIACQSGDAATWKTAKQKPKAQTVAC